MGMAKISVIVPVYNKENYLSRTLDALLGQTFRDLEIILVDDGSRDASGGICDDYAAKANLLSPGCCPASRRPGKDPEISDLHTALAYDLHQRPPGRHRRP